MSAPRLVLLADRPNWAFDFVARSLRARLSDEFSVRVEYADHRPDLSPNRYDLLHVFFWADRHHRRFDIPREKLIVEVASYRWRDEPYEFDPADLAEFLGHAGYLTTPSADLRDLLTVHVDQIFLTPNGFEPALFFPGREPIGDLSIAWVGRPEDDCKGLHDILRPACDGRFQLSFTDGSWSRERVARLYRRSDVLAIASSAESQPLPLLEAMACGCFPVSTRVGIAVRVIEHETSGLLVDRDVASFRRAFSWCRERLPALRARRSVIARRLLQDRSWNRCAEYYREVYRKALTGRLGSGRATPAAIPNAQERLRTPNSCSFDLIDPDIKSDAPGRLALRLSDLHSRWRDLLERARRRGPLRFLADRLLSAHWLGRRLGRRS